jgi:transposase
MRVKTIMNRVCRHRQFVYGKVRLVEEADGEVLEAEVRPRSGSRPVCAGCGQARPGYDTLPERRFEFVPLWGFRFFLVYAMRRVSCPSCGVKVEKVPWAEGKQQVTSTYAWFLAGWAKRLSWKEVAQVFKASWNTVARSVEMAVAWGREHVDLEGIRSVGVDELHWKLGTRYLTLVYQIDAGCRRLLWVGQERKARTLERFFRWFGKGRAARLRYVCSDMWKPYLKVIAEKAPRALLVLDRFHVVSHMSKAIDKVRASEARELKAKGYEPVLKGSRWWLLKRRGNLTANQEKGLSQLLLQANLKTVRSYLLAQDFTFFWECPSAVFAALFLIRWTGRAMRSQIEPMKKVAQMLRAHRYLLLNWFWARGVISNAAVEGLNNKANLTARKAYGFRTYKWMEIALYHTLGALPEPQPAHKYC